VALICQAGERPTPLGGPCPCDVMRNAKAEPERSKAPPLLTAEMLMAEVDDTELLKLLLQVRCRILPGLPSPSRRPGLAIKSVLLRTYVACALLYSPRRVRTRRVCSNTSIPSTSMPRRNSRCTWMGTRRLSRCRREQSAVLTRADTIDSILFCSRGGSCDLSCLRCEHTALSGLRWVRHTAQALRCCRGTPTTLCQKFKQRLEVIVESFAEFLSPLKPM
jgi:hypothetical protein